MLWRLAVKSEVWVKFILTLDCSWHLHNKTVISFLPGCARQTESHSNSIPRFLIEIYAGKVVSLAWEPPDSGENGYDVPENIAAGLISSALPGLPGLTGLTGSVYTWTRITLVEVIKRSARGCKGVVSLGDNLLKDSLTFIALCSSLRGHGASDQVEHFYSFRNTFPHILPSLPSLSQAPSDCWLQSLSQR